MGFESPQLNSTEQPSTEAEGLEKTFDTTAQKIGEEIQTISKFPEKERKTRLERIKDKINAIADVADIVLDRSVGFISKPLLNLVRDTVKRGAEDFKVTASSAIDSLAELTTKEGNAVVNLTSRSIPELTYSSGKGTTRFIKGIIDGLK